MKIDKIKVKNYRLLNDLEMTLKDDLSLIVGKNNSGKTSLLYVLDRFLNKKKSSSPISWDDFNIDFRERLEKMIENDENYIFDNINDFPGIALRLFIKYDDNDNLSNISNYMIDFIDDEYKTIIIEFSYYLSKKDFDNLKKDYRNNDNKELFLEQNFNRYFKYMEKAIIYDIERKSEGFLFKDVSKYDINKLISFKYINAKRNTSNEDEGKLSSLASRYYGKFNSDNEEEIVRDFIEVINKTDSEVTSIYEKMFKDLLEKIKKFGGVKEGDSLIRIVSEIDKSSLLKGNSKVTYVGGSSIYLPENYNGLGYLNLIYMIFEIEIKLIEFKNQENDNEISDINLFFIEEPEAHAHPQMQYIFIENIKTILKEGSDMGNDYLHLQTIITTHSSHIVSRSDFNDIKYFLHDTSKESIIVKNLSDLEYEYKDSEGDFKFLKQYLTLNSSELFFAEKAIFIEGVTERILLPSMMKKIDNMVFEDQIITGKKNLPLLSQNISIVEVGNYSHIFEKFISFIEVKSLIITDIDSAKKNDKGKYIKCEVNEAEYTTNHSLKFFYYPKTLNDLKSLKKENKIFENNEGKWTKNKQGNLNVCFQTLQQEGSDEEYYPRTFEDAFIHINKDFIIKNLSSFSSIKNEKLFKNENSPYILAEKCLDKKSSFAMEILIAEQMEILNAKQMNKTKINWKIPEYIEEGLEWLKKT